MGSVADEEPWTRKSGKYQKEWKKCLPFEDFEVELAHIELEFGPRLPDRMAILLSGKEVEKDLTKKLEANDDFNFWMKGVAVFQLVHTLAYAFLAFVLMYSVTFSRKRIGTFAARLATTVIVVVNPLVFTYGEMYRALKCFAASKLFLLTLILLILYCQLFLLIQVEMVKRAARDDVSDTLRTDFGFAFQVSWIVIGCYTFASHVSANAGSYKALVHIFNGACLVNGSFIHCLHGTKWQHDRIILRIARWMLFIILFLLPLLFGAVVTAYFTWYLPIE